MESQGTGFRIAAKKERGAEGRIRQCRAKANDGEAFAGFAY
jgi:hypothetical protein